jgi:hypothetical protein
VDPDAWSEESIAWIIVALLFMALINFITPAVGVGEPNIVSGVISFIGVDSSKQAMAAASFSGDYTVKQIEGFSGIQYTTANRAVNANTVLMRDCKTYPRCRVQSLSQS